MHDPSKPYQELLKENASLKQRIQALESSEEEIKQAQEALKITAETYRSIFLNAPVGFFRTDISTGLLLDANDALAQIIGYKNRSELLSRPYKVVESYVDPQARETIISSLKGKGEIKGFEVQFRRSDGSTVWHRLSAKIIPEKGWVEGVAEVITDRKHAEELSRKSEEKFTKVFMMTPDCIVITQIKDGLILDVNPGFEQISGWKRNEVIGRTSIDINVWGDPSERDFMVKELMAGRDILYRESQFRRKEGSLRAVIYSARSIVIDGEGCLIFILQDTTDRKQSEENLRVSERKYHELYDFLPIPIYEMDLEANIISANRAIYETFRATEADLTKDFKVWQILSPEEINKAHEKMQRLLKEEQIGGTEYTLKRLDGSSFPAIIISSAIYRNGIPVGFRGAVIDITERRQQEEELRRLTVFMDLILENIPDMIFVKDARELRFVRFNRAGEELLGYSRDDLLGKSDYDFFPKEQAEFFTEKDRAVLCGKEIFDIPEEPLQTRDKGNRILHTKKVPILGANGEPEYLLGISEDITERHQAEEALRKSEEYFREITMNSSDVLFILDAKGTITYASASVERFIGYHPEDLIGKNSLDLIIPDDHLRAIKDFAKALLTRDIATPNSFRIRHKNGSEIIMEGVGKNLLHNPIIAGFVMNIRDVTDRIRTEEALKNSEERYRNIIENIMDVYYRTDREGRLIMVSPSGLTLFGYDSEDDFIGKGIADTFYHNPEEREKILSALQEKGSAQDLEVTLRHKNGHPIPMTVSSRYYYDGNGAVLGAEGILRDIRDRKRAEEEKRSLEEQLQRAEKMEALGALAGGVAHDLNNVLGIVVGYAELLLSRVEESSPIRPGLVNIMEGGQRAAAIVQDLLTLARRGVAGRKVLNLNNIIAECLKSPEFEQLSSYHPSVNINADLDPDLLNISGSSVHIGKTIFNLVSNASEAMQKGGVVTIKTANQYLDKPVQGYEEAREGDYVVLSVSDTGEGISASDLKRIFEPFYTKKVMGRSGTGLGLAVVWGTVKDHQGYINVESVEGRGSTFTLYFPVTREDISSEAVAVSISEYMGKGESILVVDDVKGQRDLAAGILGKLNYSVTSVSSGEEAIAYIKGHHVDLMVLDMIMDPGMDGLDTYRGVLEIHPQQKAIIVSGFSETHRVDAAHTLGAGAYVRKPYIIEKLGLAVRKELDRNRN